MDHKISYVTGFLFDETLENVLLISKTMPVWQKGRLNGVGGKIEKNELARQAMIREFKEETDLDFTQWKRFGVLSPLHGDIFLYVGKSTLSFITSFKQTTEELPVVASVSKILEPHNMNTVPNVKWLLPMAINSLIYGDNKTVYLVNPIDNLDVEKL